MGEGVVTGVNLGDWHIQLCKNDLYKKQQGHFLLNGYDDNQHRTYKDFVC